LHEKNIKFVRCVKCSGKVSLKIFKELDEIEEGFLICNNCKTKFPIINKIPILLVDFTTYLGNRASLGGKLYGLAKTITMKQFIKKSLSNITTIYDDYSFAEQIWAQIYHTNRNSSFYTYIKSKLSELPSYEYVLEFGSSVGIISNFLRRKNNNVFGIDLSFFATMLAKEKSFANSDFFVADLLNHPFKKKKFNLILALNILDVVEPNQILKKISNQISNGHVILSDPYDYIRGKRSVRFPLYETDVRKKMRELGFSITNGTRAPSYINWNLSINPRAKLSYKVDIIIGKK
tara:strand:+ start:218 stop:1090 length:873 start_codon:yes stop_codon:yes gene_type:complete